MEWSNELGDLIKDVIRNEFYHTNDSHNGMEGEEKKELEENIKILKELKEYFRKTLSKDDYEKLIKIYDTFGVLDDTNSEYFFYKGAMSAFTDLSFLTKYSNVF